uniref:Uncharacterized protein n=1 Tax=Oryza nivara TaxID=4536 RepID=A0A0E0JC22_ORYNI
MPHHLSLPLLSIFSWAGWPACWGGSRWGEAGEEDRRRWPATGDAAAVVTTQEQVGRRSGQVTTIISEQFPPDVDASIATVEIYLLVEMKWKERSGTVKTAKRRGGWGNDMARMAAGEQERCLVRVLVAIPVLIQISVSEVARTLSRRTAVGGGSIAATLGLAGCLASPPPPSCRACRPSRASADCACSSNFTATVAHHSSLSASTERRLTPPPCSPPAPPPPCSSSSASTERKLPLPTPPSSPPVGQCRRPAWSPREKKSEREKRGKKDEADLDRLTYGARVGSTLTQ